MHTITCNRVRVSGTTHFLHHHEVHKGSASPPRRRAENREPTAMGCMRTYGPITTQQAKQLQ